MFFVPCIVIQLCNVNQPIHTFQINGLIQFLASSTCFEHHVFIIRKTICKCRFCMLFFMHLCKQSRKLQDVLGTEHTKVRVQLVFSDDEHMMFKTCRSGQELN